jgi:serine/threonine protein kinase
MYDSGTSCSKPQKVQSSSLSNLHAHSEKHEAVLGCVQRGTLAYMATEMYDHDAPITYAADVYSYGVLLNEIVTGETPNKRRGLTMPRHAILSRLGVQK